MASYDALPKTFAGKINIRRVPLNAGGYAYGRYGKYWGGGQPLWLVVGFDEEGWEVGSEHERADDKNEVMDMYPFALVRGQRYCRIHEDCRLSRTDPLYTVLAETCHADRMGIKIRRARSVHLRSRLLDQTGWPITGDAAEFTDRLERGKLPNRNPTEMSTGSSVATSVIVGGLLGLGVALARRTV